MSDYSEKISNDGYECPYCGYEHFCDDWGYSYDNTEMKCDECGKKFRATADHSVTFLAEPDCELNGEQHRLGPVKNHALSWCDKCDALVPNEGT